MAQHNIEQLELLIKSVLDKEKTCKELPNVCSLLDSEQGRQRIIEAVKKKILEENIDTIDAALGQIENSMSEID